MSDDRILERMRANPRGDWTISDVERLWRRYGVAITPPRGGSHYEVRDPAGPILTIPARRPVKPVYIRALVGVIDRLRTSSQKP